MRSANRLVTLCIYEQNSAKTKLEATSFCNQKKGGWGGRGLTLYHVLALAEFPDPSREMRAFESKAAWITFVFSEAPPPAKKKGVAGRAKWLLLLCLQFQQESSGGRRLEPPQRSATDVQPTSRLPSPKQGLPRCDAFKNANGNDLNRMI